MAKLKVSIVIPTYNERRNVEILIPKILRVCKKYDCEIIVVDDNSPDGTSSAIENPKSRNKITLLKRKRKLGLGSAYIDGFKLALEDKPDLIFQMDADLSHKPDYMSSFIEKIGEGYDVAIGSRLMKGGGVVGWNLARKLISWGGNFIGRYVAGINVSDLTSGYRVYRREVLESLKLNGIKSLGYDFQLEMLAKVIKKGFRVGTVPIVFHEREYGKSKLTKLDQLRFLDKAVKIRLGYI